MKEESRECHLYRELSATSTLDERNRFALQIRHRKLASLSSYVKDSMALTWSCLAQLSNKETADYPFTSLPGKDRTEDRTGQAGA